MNGNGQDAAPQSTASIWGDMFGMGSLFKLVTDPMLGATAQRMMETIIESSLASRRLEAKLDLLLKGQGHDIDAVNARFAGLGPPALLEMGGAARSRSDPASSHADDDGVGADQAGARPGGNSGSADPAGRAFDREP